MRARVGGAPQLGKSTHPRKLAKHVTVHRPSGPALLRFWFQTDLRHETSASYLKIQAGKTFPYHGHAQRPII